MCVGPKRSDEWRHFWFCCIFGVQLRPQPEDSSVPESLGGFWTVNKDGYGSTRMGMSHFIKIVRISLK